MTVFSHSLIGSCRDIMPGVIAAPAPGFVQFLVLLLFHFQTDLGRVGNSCESSTDGEQSENIWTPKAQWMAQDTKSVFRRVCVGWLQVLCLAVDCTLLTDGHSWCHVFRLVTLQILK